MRRWVWIVVGFWLLTPILCSAGWYKYQDENGVWHYTDSMTADEPVEKRKKVEQVREPDDYLTPAQREEKRQRAAQAKASKASEEEAAAEKAKQEKIKSDYQGIDSYESLEQKRAELADLYKTMVEKKKELDAAKGKVDTRQKFAKHQELITQYNKSADEYRSRRQAYEEAVKAYEAKQRQAKPSSK